MELSIRVQAPEVDKADREALSHYLDHIVKLLDLVGYTPVASLVLAEREELEEGEYSLSKLGEVYTIFHGIEIVAEIYDEELARKVYEEVKNGA